MSVCDSFCVVDCDVPMSPMDGTVDTPDHTREGAIVEYMCDDGFRPSANFTSTCESTALWTPPPEDHNCTFVTGTKFANLFLFLKCLYFVSSQCHSVAA